MPATQFRIRTLLLYIVAVAAHLQAERYGYALSNVDSASFTFLFALSALVFGIFFVALMNLIASGKGDATRRSPLVWRRSNALHRADEPSGELGTVRLAESVVRLVGEPVHAWLMDEFRQARVQGVVRANHANQLDLLRIDVQTA